MHLACRSLLAGESDLAIAAGVNCILAPEMSISFSKGSMLSPDGRCKAFDARANGYVRGEGAGLVVLKPLSLAQRDGDAIYAVVLASGVNQDGRTPGMTVPSRTAQEALLREVYQQVDVALADVAYIEAHGTGTPVGDPIEANAIGTVLGADRATDRPLPIGSVKSNIGHLEAASGVAGLIKAALVLKHRRIPASLHFESPNPKIALDHLGLRVQHTLGPLPVCDGPAVAGVNSFGFGGTNAHVVLQEFASARPRVAPDSGGPLPRASLVPLSARTPEALVASAEALEDFLSGTEGGRAARLEDVRDTLALRRSHLETRAAVVAASREELVDELRSFVATRRASQEPAAHDSVRSSKVAFVFSGMGPQWAGMARELLADEPVFRRAVERCDALFQRHAGWSVIDALMADGDQSRMQEAEVAQPANFVVQIGLAELWASWGIAPDAIVGHSAGEVAAAVVAGALSVEDGVKVIFHRSRLQQRATSLGRMLAIGLGGADAAAAVEEHQGLVSIAAINGPSSVTLSGDSTALAAIADTLATREVFNRLLDVSVPYHSHYMDPLEGDVREALSGLDVRPAAVPLYSTVTGALVDGQAFDASYWWSNIRQTVLFASAVEALVADGYQTFVEIAPHPVLAHSVRECLNARSLPGVVLPSLRRGRERTTMLESLGTLFSHGLSVDWAALSPAGREYVKLPTYPWQRERCWHESEASAHHRLADPVHPLLQHRMESPDMVWETHVTQTMPPYLKDHAIQGSVIYPAAAYIEMALAVARELGDELTSLAEIEFKRALILGRDATQQLRFSLDAQQSAFAIHSRARESGQPWTLHATGHLRLKRGTQAAKAPLLDQIQRRCPATLTRAECYELLGARGLQYGPRFQGIDELWQGRSEALGRITTPELASAEIAEYQCHPAILDACFQVLMGAVLLDGEQSSGGGTYLPVHIGRVRLFRAGVSGPLWCHARLTGRSAGSLIGDLVVFDGEGQVVVDVADFRCQHIADARPAEDWGRCTFQTRWYVRSLHGPRAARRADDLPPPSRIAACVPQPSALTRQFDRRRHYEEFEPQLDAVCAAYIFEALRDMGWSPLEGEHVAPSALASLLGVVPAHYRLFCRLLEILGEEGVLLREEIGWTVSRTPGSIDALQAWKALAERRPDCRAVLDPLGVCGPRIADVLQGRQDPLQLLFPRGSTDLLRPFYEDAPSQKVYNHLVERMVASAVAELPPGRTLRILEIGSGTGATTAHVLSVLPANRTEYVFTDVSATLTAFGQRRFRDYPFVQYQLLDIERDPEEQGFSPHTFDLILAADVLHATRDLRETIGRVKRLLASDGLLVALEQTRSDRFLDLVFGLLKDWWRFEDVALRGNHPWLSRDGWDRLLREEQFKEIAILTDVSDHRRSCQAVFVARGPSVAELARGPESVTTPAMNGRWLVFADRGGVGERLASTLRHQGATPILVLAGASFATSAKHSVDVRPDSREDFEALLAFAGPDLRGVVHLWSLDVPVVGDDGVPGLETAQRLGCTSTLNLVQALAAAGYVDPPRLWLVTSGAQFVDYGDEITALAQAPLWGIGRVLANEHPRFLCTLVDLDPKDVVGADAALWREIAAGDLEQEVAMRGSARYVTRLVRSPESVQAAAQTRLGRTPPFFLEASRPGVLDSLVLREAARIKPGPNDVEIRVRAAGLNFRDVMKAMGLYPTEDGLDTWLGDECSGTVVRVGRAVEDLKVGDEVMAVAPGALRSFVTIEASQVVRKPAGLTFEEAATIPIVFLTVIYALKHLAQLSRGERILIHAAAGGVGLAALQIARHEGAEIFATAGSPEKRDYLRSQGANHVMDSRSQRFVDEVMEITGDRGVAVVLNSLAGEFIPNSLSLVEPAGRFIELGKIDIYQDTRLGLAHFKNGRSFFAVDLGWLLRHRPALGSSLLREVAALFESGVCRPLPVTSFPASDAAGAFRHMAQAKHIGKIVLSLTNVTRSQVQPSPRQASLVSGRATYLVTGGLTGFGLAIAQWLVRQGARHLVLVGRRGMSTAEGEAAVRRMVAAGATVRAAAVDVTQADQVAGLIDEIDRTMPPLRGVFHAAMVLDDGYLTQLDEERLTRVMAPKVMGGWNLHTATLGKPLDYFVSFSSMSSILGTVGQGNYSAANAFLDGLAHYRRARGLPALTVNWGNIADVGYVARNADIGRYFERQGLEGLKAVEAEAILGQLLRTDPGQVSVIRADFEKLSALGPSAQWSRRLAHVLREDQTADGAGESAAGERGAVLNQIRSVAAPKRIELVESVLRGALARVLKIPGDRIDPHAAFGSMGLDSLMAVELETVVKSEIAADLSLGFLAGGETTLRQLAARLVDQLVPAAVPT